jgi:hypothetical protein
VKLRRFLRRIILYTFLIIFVYNMAHAIVNDTHTTPKHRPAWQLDPQGHQLNHGNHHCEKTQVPLYIYDIPTGHKFFIECQRGNSK